MSTLPMKNRTGTILFWIVIGVLFVIMPFGGKVVGLITDYLWFKEVNLKVIFTTILGAQIGLGVIGGLAAFVVIYANIFIAQRLAQKQVVGYSNLSAAISMAVPRLMQLANLVLAVAALVIAFMIGTALSGQWESMLFYVKAVPFGQNDPLFGKDIGFYVFQLPFFRVVYKYCFAALLLGTLGSAVVYIIRQNIGTDGRRLVMTKAAKTHLLLLVGALVASAWFLFQLKLFGMVNVPGHMINGAGFAAIHYQIPSYRILQWLSLIAGLLIWINMTRRGFILAIGAVVLIVGGSFVTSSIVQMVQRFVVAPNELSKETPYINWSIASTREAFNLNTIQEREFMPNTSLTASQVAANSATTQNIRLWDQGPLLTTYGQLQEIRSYYNFFDVDNDRYMIDGQLRQVMLSPRELLTENLPNRNWISEHLSYTHGYGLCLGPVNTVTAEGLPDFFIKNIPPASTNGFSVTRPQIYFGEGPSNYTIVNTRSQEFDYSSSEDSAGKENVYTSYSGAGGVRLSSLFKKMLYVMRYKELKIFLSSDITRQSRILYNCNIMQRVRTAAPFLKFDSDPYMVITTDGRLIWIVDGYTTTSEYPYSRTVGGFGNYIRNSVKVVIDAYDGTLDMYLADTTDPVIKTYSAMFPGVFKPIAEMPTDIRAHIRYPQSLFAIQAHVYSLYHMTDPQVFYNREDLWKIAETITSSDSGTVAPYYTIMKLAEVGKSEEFILMVPFSPAKKDNMIAWMAARCDEPNYGKLLVFNFPKQEMIYGPRQIESRINQDPEISKQLTLWSQAGSRVIRGNLLVIPVEQSLLYVQPLYLSADGGGGVPELKRVIVAFSNSIAMEPTLEGALLTIFGGGAATKSVSTAISSSTVANSPVLTESIKQLITKTSASFNKAQDQLSRRDFAGYGESMKEVEDLLKDLAKKAQ